MKKGFTLIELLIVVAIIAILAAIAVPNFLEAQVRAKVSRVKNDQRSLATGIETYYVDNNQYPIAARDGGGNRGPLGATIPINPTGAGNVNKYVTNASAEIAQYNSFAARPASGNGSNVATLTTPISYVTSYFADPFTDTKGATFGYMQDTNGWILWSPGPDTDEKSSTDLQPSVETVYNSAIAQPSTQLLTGGSTGTGKGAFTYDPTNGTVSEGDIYRVKQ